MFQYIAHADSRVRLSERKHNFANINVDHGIYEMYFVLKFLEIHFDRIDFKTPAGGEIR